MNLKIKFSDFTLKENTDFWIIVFNSLVYYLLAILTVILSSNLFALLLGAINEFQGKLFYYGFIIYPIDGHWSQDDVALIFMFGIMYTLFFAILFERLYKWRRKYSENIKLYFLWCYILAITWFFGNVIIGAFSNYSIGAVMEVLGIPMVIRIIIAILFGVLLFFLGRLSIKNVLISGNIYFKHLHSDKNFFLIKAQLLFPAILGILAYFLYRIPHQGDYQFRDTLAHMTVLIFILGAFWGTLQPRSIGFKRKRDWIDFDFYALGILTVIAIFIRVFLRDGISI